MGLRRTPLEGLGFYSPAIYFLLIQLKGVGPTDFTLPPSQFHR